ncbi:protein STRICTOSIDINE SYNTHASE-LIKE 6-like [Malania oleifera]|uniref:protein STRICTOSIDINE SYNTHASE-LIKE 6-like n=1 Tax=Malania oleifera TaxID=397392 RepID=UPI0025ADB6C6|nr:protein STRICTOSIDINE SYNTHASE-LIKE 6-like [Malania oleifera]
MADAPTKSERKSLWPGRFLLPVLVPVTAALILLFNLDPFDPARLPAKVLDGRPIALPRTNARLLRESEFIGRGSLLAPEDIAYDSESGVIYTGCMDGWIKRVTVREPSAESLVENWVEVGGRPLGLVVGKNKEVIVAHPDQGLLNISRDGGEVELLTDEADGVKFRLTDGVDVAEDGIIYFTDASYKYNFSGFLFDVLEGRPHGRLLSYDPSTRLTKVLLRDLYFGNGVAVSPDQNSVVFCETVVRRCRKYHIKGERKGWVDSFVENIPGIPDNVKYDGEGRYWIALSMEFTPYWFWDAVFRYPAIRKVLGILERYHKKPHLEKNGGVLAVDLEGKPTARYYDPALSLISSGIKIGNHLYCGSLANSYLLSFNLTQNPALAAS